MISWKWCDGVPNHINPRQTPKPCAIAHENARNARNHEFSMISWKWCDGVPNHINPRQNPKPCAIAQENARNARNHDFSMISWKSCDGVPDHLNPRRTAKPCAIAHENRQKCTKSRVFYDFVKIVWRGTGPIKSTPHPKNVCYSPQKRSEMHEITSFLWFREYRGTASRTILIHVGP